jgi:NADH-quinone oxidoreductase subunit E
MAKLSPETQERIRYLKDRFPQRRSAVLPSLHYAQAELGYLDDETLAEVAALLDVPLNMTSEVVGFYTMFDRGPKGTYKLEVCRNLSCALMGADKLVRYLEDKLGIRAGQTTPDGKFFLTEVECMGACGYAPMLAVGPNFYEFLTREKVDAILTALGKDQEPPLPPAGHFETDGVSRPKVTRDAVPPASRWVRETLAVSAGTEEGRSS